MSKFIRNLISSPIAIVIATISVLGLIYQVFGATNPTNYWVAGALFIAGLLFSLQASMAQAANRLISGLREIIVGSLNVGLVSIKEIQDDPPSEAVAQVTSTFQFVGVAGSKFLREAIQDTSFFRENTNPSAVQIILTDPFSDDIQRLSQKPGIDPKDREKIIESLEYLDSLRIDGYKFEVRLYPTVPPVRLMICDQKIVTLSMYSADSSGWRNAQLTFDKQENRNALAPYFGQLFNDLWIRALNFELSVRTESLTAINSRRKYTAKNAVLNTDIFNCKDNTRKAPKFGMVHGRFQPFHREHLEYVLLGITASEYCYIAITQPDIENLKTGGLSSAEHRNKPSGNPFSYAERSSMIRLSLDKLGINPDRYKIISMEIEQTEDSKRFKLSDECEHDFSEITQIMKIFSDWELEKKKAFEIQGGDVICISPPASDVCRKNVTGTMLRELVNSKRNWRDYSPSGTTDVISHKLDV